MVFPTIEFAAFFAVVMAGSWSLMPRPHLWKPFILGTSYFFYGYADKRFVALLLASTALNQAAALALARWRDRRILITAISCDLGLLGWFKYYGFFALSVDRMLDRIGLPAPLPLLQVALPVGISFFTFQAMSYVIDVHRGTILPAKTSDFAVYQAFFPHLVAGPIVRASEFIPQLATPRDPDQVPATRAIFLIVGGLVKKIALADLLATQIVDPVFDTPSQHSSLEVLVAIYGYGVQIYCDFSAYSDMAIGIALLLGFSFPDNFDRPYTAASLREFWRRWHITLSRWLRDYVYVPLGGNRHGPRRTYVNLMITMILGGLWHGAAWTFVIWGALHGAGLAAERRWAQSRRRPAAPAVMIAAAVMTAAAPWPQVPAPRTPRLASRHSGTDSQPHPPATVVISTATTSATTSATTAVAGGPAGAASRLYSVARPVARLWFGRLVVFHFVCATWVLFRSPDVEAAIDIFVRLVSAPGPAPLVTREVLLAIATGLLTQLTPKSWRLHAADIFSQLSVFGQAVVIVGFILIAHAIVGRQDVAPFIYFRF
ncbi:MULTISPECIES: MBOAT family O-acyltransferase [unclassified Frankia]|uniref:MBOAT family O-acyltransferase n=1 Tax=unclassified Frankia TaxID=2632575 RepID=UPI002AD2CF2C|nr:MULTISPECIES: MBOAT family O-acyltransferase [unclassified Frankia]